MAWHRFRKPAEPAAITELTEARLGRCRLSAFGFSILALACVGGSSAPRPLTDVAEPLATALATLQVIRIEVAEGGGTLVSLEADRPLRWTSYRDIDGSLIVELPSTRSAVPAETMATDDSLLVTRVEAIETRSGFRGVTGTRLRMLTRDDAVHALEARGPILELRFRSPATREAGPAPEARTSRPRARTRRERTESSTGDASSMVPSSSVPSSKDPSSTARAPTIESESLDAPMIERPATSSAAQQGSRPPATPRARGTEVERVFSRRVDGGWVVFITGNGPFEATWFRLDDPPRFVVDLRGVANRAGTGSLGLDGPSALRARWAQFEDEPVPITRIVIDLVHTEAEVRIEPAPAGIRLRIPPAP